MIPLPEPLHPAVVHFPIALLLLGAAVAGLAIFVRRWHLPLFAALLLSLGAAGAVVAVATGENEEEVVEHAIPSAEPLLEEHARWGDMARNLGLAAAALAVVAAFFVSKPFFGRAFSVLTALVAFAAAYCVAEAGHFGGDLVYRHGAGVMIKGEPSIAGERNSNRPGARHEDDDE